MSSAQAQAVPAAPPTLSPEERKMVAELVADGLSIQDKFRPEPLYKETGKGHFDNDAVGEIKRVKERPLNGANHGRE